MWDLPREVIKGLHRPTSTAIPPSKVYKEPIAHLEAQRKVCNIWKPQLGVKISLTLASKGTSYC